MEFSEFVNYLIPGYLGLTPYERHNFEQSMAGQQLHNHFDITKESLRKEQYRVIRPFLDPDIQSYAKKNKNNILATIENTEEYQILLGQIFIHYIIKEMPGFALLGPQERLEFCRLSKIEAIRDKFLKIIPDYDQAERDVSGVMTRQLNVDRFTLLTQLKQECCHEWNAMFQEDAVFATFRKSIAVKKEKNRLDLLAQKFPLLNNNELYDQFLNKYCDKIGQRYKTEQEIEQEILVAIIQDLLHENIETNFPYINVADFNQKKAAELAKEVINSCNNKTHFDLKKWCNDYHRALEFHFKIQMRGFERMKWADTPNAFLKSLSFLWKNAAVEYAKNFANKVADAHIFISNGNLGSNSDSAYGAVVDAYNTLRLHRQVSEFKSIILGLSRPILPIYREYREIAYSKSNPLIKVAKILIPLLIFSGFVALMGWALAPLVLPDLAFLAAMIPIVVIGLVLAAQYINIKNYLYNRFQAVRQYLYGGKYNVPEYQVNERMITIFGSENLATIYADKVRDLYIAEIEKCDEQEAWFKAHPSAIEQQKREDNIVRREELRFEWYDIHNNTDLTHVEVRKIIMARLYEFTTKEYQTQEKNFIENDVKVINTHFAKSMESLAIALYVIPQVEKDNEPDSDEENINDIMQDFSPKIEENNRRNSKNINGFFMPSYLENKKKILEINTISDHLYNINLRA